MKTFATFILLALTVYAVSLLRHNSEPPESVRAEAQAETTPLSTSASTTEREAIEAGPDLEPTDDLVDGSLDEPPSLSKLPSFEQIAAEEEAFKERWSTTAEAGLREENLRLCNQIVEAYSPVFAERFAAGEYQRVADAESGINVDESRRHYVESYIRNDEGDYLRTTLPEGRYPEAYAIMRRINWLQDLVEQRRH